MLAEGLLRFYLFPIAHGCRSTLNHVTSYISFYIYSTFTLEQLHFRAQYPRHPEVTTIYLTHSWAQYFRPLISIGLKYISRSDWTHN